MQEVEKLQAFEKTKNDSSEIQTSGSAQLACATPIASLVDRYFELEQHTEGLQQKIASRIFPWKSKKAKLTHQPGQSLRHSSNSDDILCAKSKANIARQHLPEKSLLRGIQLIRDIDTDSIEYITEIDNEYRLNKLFMKSLEEQILNEKPDSKDEAVLKLNFLCGLIIHDADVDNDSMAFVIAECVDVILSSGQ